MSDQASAIAAAMKTLITRAEYEQRLSEMIRKFSIIPVGSEINPGPGRLRLLEAFLQRAKRAIGRSRIAFLELLDDDHCGVQAWIDTNHALPDGRNAALRTAIKTFTQAAVVTCRLCEKPADGKGRGVYAESGFCTEHETIGRRGIRFADDDTSVLADLLQPSRIISIPDTNSSLDPLVSGNVDIDFGESSIGEEHSFEPYASLYEQQKVDALEQYAKTRGDRETKQRLQALVDSIRNREQWRKLAQLPDGWQYRLDELELSFPNFGVFINFLRFQFALAEKGDRVIKISPVLLNGQPGIGKTEILHRLAVALNLPPPIYFDFSTMQTPARMVGTDAHWANAAEGELFRTLVLGQIANPIVFVDEVEKARGEGRYDPVAALLGLLETTSARRFQDQGLRDFPIDASHMVWIAAANRAETLDDPVKSRFTLLEVPSPSAQQMRGIHRAIYEELKAAEAWGRHFGALPEATLDVLCGVSPREAKLLLRTGAGSACLVGRSVVHPEDIQQFKPPRKLAANFVSQVAAT